MRQNEYKKILDEYKNNVFGYVYYILKNREDAEDVTQDVFIRLWNNRDKVKHKTRKAWIMRVAHNRCMDLLRQKKASIAYDKIAMPLLSEIIPDSSPTSNPELFYTQQETNDYIVSALNMLPDKMKSVMLMHYFQGFKYKEISNILNTTESSVKITIHRGKKVLKKILSDHFPEKQLRFSDEKMC